MPLEQQDILAHTHRPEGQRAEQTAAGDGLVSATTQCFDVICAATTLVSEEQPRLLASALALTLGIQAEGVRLPHPVRLPSPRGALCHHYERDVGQLR